MPIGSTRITRSATNVYGVEERTDPGYHRVDRRKVCLALGAAVDACSAEVPAIAHAHGVCLWMLSRLVEGVWVVPLSGRRRKWWMENEACGRCGGRGYICAGKGSESGDPIGPSAQRTSQRL
jgi:hypothetical protein